MNIPDKAVEAAVQALFEDGCGEPKVDAATALEAAAPFIAAQALREHAAQLAHDAERSREDEHIGLFLASDKTWARAEDMDPQ